MSDVQQLRQDLLPALLPLVHHPPALYCSCPRTSMKAKLGSPGSSEGRCSAATPSSRRPP